MERIEELSNTAKAKVLHELFPDEIPALLQFVGGMSATIEEEQETIKKSWKNEPFDFEYWLSLAIEAGIQVYKNSKTMKINSSLFAYWLFYGDAAQFLTYCLLQYTIPRRHTNAKFSLAVELLLPN